MCAFNVSAQKSEYGLFLASTNYFGDLNPNYSFKQNRIGEGLFYRLNLNNRMAVRVGVSHAWVAASDEKLSQHQPYLQARNLSFQSNIIELSGLYEINFFDWEQGGSKQTIIKKKKWTPYMFVGIGFYHFSSYTTYKGQKVNLEPIGTEGQKNPNAIGEKTQSGYSPFAISIPFGGGIKYSLNKNWTVQVELMTRKTFNDNLDDVHAVYPDASELNYIKDGVNFSEALSDRSPELGIAPIGYPGKQRGSSKDNDRFNFYSIGITYTFNTIKCPTIQ
ncbi:MAG: DUF6089 family protein [Chitinophagales bacterium]|nr:DUF6089 family protein [Chitinophagales bacterium]